MIAAIANPESLVCLAILAASVALLAFLFQNRP